jgi:hypothetical protein
MSIGRLLGCSLVVALVAAACSDDESESKGAGASGGSAGTAGKSGSGGGGTGGTGGSGGSGGSSGSTGGTAGAAADAGLVTLSGTVVEGIPGSFGNEPLLAGVEACVVDASGTRNTAIPCSLSDSAGEFALVDLAPNQELIVMFSKAGFPSQVIAVDIGAADIARGAMRMGQYASDSGADGGVVNFGWDPALVIDSTKGTFNTVAVQSAATPDAGVVPGFSGLDWTTGVSFTISPAEGDGPYYVATDETWATSATATVNYWGAWVMNLPPGTYTVTATHPTLTCAASGGGYGWADTDGTARVPVLAGMNTQATSFFCAPPPSDAGTD